MRFGIFGDIHGNLEALESVLEDMEAQAIRQVACTGDIVGQYANSRECLEIVRALGCPLIIGNHDERAFNNPSDDSNLSTTRSRVSALTREQRDFLRSQPLQRSVSTFTLVHSNLERPAGWTPVATAIEAETSFQHQETDICFFGHTHIPQVFILDTRVHHFSFKKIDIQNGRKYFVNVGSVGEPRDGDWRAAYVIYDSDASTIELRRLPFDLAKAQAKIK